MIGLAAMFMVMASPEGADALRHFAYEIGRAKGAASVYANNVYRDERIHRRSGRLGSSVETYCATNQSRNDEGKVEERQIHWVVRVRPANGYLSDYERGAWSQPEPGGASDYEKLCVTEGVVDDSQLLRSKHHSTQSGSLYDPTGDPAGRVSREWLVGDWVATTNCATSRDVLFRSDGTYEGEDERGRWELVGETATITINETATLDEKGFEESWALLPKPKHHTVPLQRLAIDRLRTHGKYDLLRC